MNDWNALAPARLASRTLAAIGQTAILTTMLAVAGASLAVAQQPPAPAAAPAPVAKPKPPAKKPAVKPPVQPQAPAAGSEVQQPVPGAPGAPAAQGQAGEMPPLIYSPWTKFCLKGQESEGKQICFTGKDARIESGMPVVAAVLIEPEGAPQKILRVTVPLGMRLLNGTRVLIDQNQPMTAPFVVCFQAGCMADYEVTPDLIAKLKKGQLLVVQALNFNGQQGVNLPLPLTDFAKAYDGPPTDPKVFEEQQNKLQEELQRRADEARKKLEGQQGAPGAPALPPGAPGAAPAPAPQPPKP